MKHPLPQPPAPCVLLTGFDAFGGATMNPSQLVAEALHGEQRAGHTLVAGVLPTVFGDALPELARLMRHYKPALIICLGQAGGRRALSLERVAINIQDASLPDNAGQQPLGTPVVAGGPAAYFTSLPIRAMLYSLQQAGVAAEVSTTAGTFVCNHVFYGLMHSLARRRANHRPRGGFVHVPYLPEQGTPSMTLADMVQGLRIAINAALTAPVDVKDEKARNRV